jgi:hypothetical protein
MKAYRGDGAPKRDAINDLDCIDCGAWFPSFAELAAHVTNRHTAPQAQKDDRDMRTPKSKRAARATSEKDAAMKGTRIPKSDSGGTGEYNPFLKVEHVGKRLGARATLVLTGAARVSDGTYGQQILAEVKIGSKLFDYAVKVNSMNHSILEQRVGDDTKRWKGKKLPVIVKENMGKLYVAIERP